MATAESDNFFSKLPAYEPSADRWSHATPFASGKAYAGWEFVASGYAAVWATENTRESLWEAMKRKETYATTGPRMTVRFFGGWGFNAEDAKSHNLAKAGYTKGVPMGGDLSQAPAGKSPTFLVAAFKDPIGANLDRVQVVKGWMDVKGGLQEKVYRCSLEREPQAGNRRQTTRRGGDTVDMSDATYKNTIGASELITTWKDPDFDPALKAFYYVRVLEIPTPRWTLYDTVRYKVKMDPKVPMVEQQRAYTSPTGTPLCQENLRACDGASWERPLGNRCYTFCCLERCCSPLTFCCIGRARPMSTKSSFRQGSLNTSRRVSRGSISERQRRTNCGG